MRSLVWYPLLYNSLCTFSVANWVDLAVDPANTIKALWYLHVFTSGGAVALAYYFDSESRRRLTWAKLKAAISYCCGRDGGDQYLTIPGSNDDSVAYDEQ